MIRFACGTCAKSLRAPAHLAGKRGRCAQCGAINPIPHPTPANSAARPPVIVNVDVRRAAGPSPFRTADLPVRAAIEGPVEVAGARFLATGPSATAIQEAPRDFVDHIASRMTEIAEPYAPDEAHAPPPPPSRTPAQRRAAVARAAAAVEPTRRAIPMPLRDGYDLHFEPRSPDVTRAVAAALVVGAVIGFCVGLVACKWIL